MELNITKIDPNLLPYEKDLTLRMENYKNTKARILKDGELLSDFANAHLYFGFHAVKDGWYYREWAPGADAMYLTGDFCGWDRHAHPMEKKENGVFELFLPGKDALQDGQRVCAIVVRNGQEFDRIPVSHVLYAGCYHRFPVHQHQESDGSDLCRRRRLGPLCSGYRWCAAGYPRSGSGHRRRPDPLL